MKEIVGRKSDSKTKETSFCSCSHHLNMLNALQSLPKDLGILI